MLLKKLTLATLGVAVGATVGFSALIESAQAQQQNGQFIPGTIYRSGPFAPGGIPWADGYADYVNLLNARDGGINGVPLIYEECDTAYNTDRGVECYERLKNRGPTGAAGFQPLSTGITYALMDRAPVDKIPVISAGYGRASASYGRIFEWTFTLPVTYWAGADAIIQHIEAQENGDLKGKKIALVYLDSAFGKEPIPTLQALSQKLGYEFRDFAVAAPGLEQRATWLQVARQWRADYVILWGWGVMNSTAISEAASAGFPMDRMIGIWWSGGEDTTRTAPDLAKGYKSAQFHNTGADFQVHRDIFTHLYDKGQGSAQRDRVGEIIYNRGLISAVFLTEGIRRAMEEFGNQPMTGEQVRWGMENLDLNEERLAALGLTGLLAPVKLSCEDHEGGGSVFIQQWNGTAWEPVSEPIQPRREGFLWDMYKEAAEQYAREQNITPRDCN